MKKIWCILITAFLLISCSGNKNNSDPTEFIPKNSSIILSINNLESLKSDLNNNHLLQELSKTGTYKNIATTLQNLEHLKTTHRLLVCFTEDQDDSLHYTIITKFTKNLFKVDSLPNISVETLKLKKHTLQKTIINNKTTYSTIKDSIFIASSSKNLLEAILTNRNKNDTLKAFLNTLNSNKSISILLKNKNKHLINSFFINDSIRVSNFTNYTLFDAELNQDEIILNGITKATDSTKSLINIFKNTIPQENLLAQITPANIDGFMSFTFDTFHVFKENLDRYNPLDSVSTDTTLFDNIIEVGVIYEGNNKAIVLNSIDEIDTKDALLDEQDLSIKYRQIDIYNYSKPQLFNKTFTPLVVFNAANYYCVIDHFFVFSNSLETLQNIITNYQNKTTFSERNYYQNIEEHLLDESSLMVVSNSSTVKHVLEKKLNEDLNINIDSYKASVLQFVYDNNFAHVNAIFKKNKTRARENSVSEAYNIKLDAELLNNPEFVINHRTKQKEIVVQDVNNNLYLISNKGKVLWKKQLRGKVLGKIEQIDIYKNGRLQLVFATPNRVYVLDRNGKDVAPFPLKFNDAITQPLSVFDYDKKKTYRLLVTQGKNVLMYDVKGKNVKGFQFKSASSIINHQPQHFRIGSKDYITIKTNNRLHILDRTGRTRVKLKNSYSYSNQALYLYKNKFTTTTSDGKLIAIDTKGNSSTQNLNLTDHHNITTTSKTLVTQHENKLSIKSKTLELDYGIYSVPKLFYINDKIYISVTDLQTQKVHLFDSNAKSLYNFPVYGNSTIELDNIDKDRNLEFVTKGENNSIIIYQIN